MSSSYHLRWEGVALLWQCYQKGHITRSEWAAATRVQGTAICLHFKRQPGSWQPSPQVPAAPALPPVPSAFPSCHQADPGWGPQLSLPALRAQGLYQEHPRCSCLQLQEQPGLLSGTSKVTRNEQRLKLSLVVAYLCADLHLFKLKRVWLGQAKQQAA